MPLNIAIAGAGIGGLVAAVGLARNGHNVTLYERLTHSGGVGYSFAIMKNASRCLNFVGVDPRKTGAVDALCTRQFKASNGELLREIVEHKSGPHGDTPFSGYVSRGALSEDLTQAAIEAGAKIQNGVKVVRADVARNALIFASGDEVLADVIIGADGIHSPVRRSFVDGERAQPRCSGGQNAVRFLLPMSRVQQTRETSTISPSEGVSAMWFSRDRRVIAYPIDFGKTLSIASAYPAQLSDNVVKEQDGDTAASYSKKVSLETVLEIHSDFEPRVQSLLKLADPEGFRVWKLEDLDDIGAWSSGHTTVLGDACHATLPGSFSGAAMAIEDGATLAILLDSGVAPADVEARFKIYEKIRKPRVNRVRDYGRSLETAVKSDVDVRNYLEFIDGHDAVKTARQALEGDSA